MSKRYSIQRTDRKDCGKCEFAYKGKDKKIKCKIGGMWQCDHLGDTKEQMIKKVTQVMKRQTRSDGLVIPAAIFQESKTLLWEVIAKDIVEFLGME